MSKALTDLTNKKRLKMDDLTVVKFTLKSQINAKQQQLIHSAKSLNPFSKEAKEKISYPLSLLNVPRRKGKILSIITGIVTGIKLVNNIRSIVKHKKKRV